MMRRSVRTLCNFLVLAVLACAPRSISPGIDVSRRPDIVLVMMDDIGYGDLGSYGAPDAKTPNIDRLARLGVRFTESYSNAADCTPTRAALISGRYQQRVGIETVTGMNPAPGRPPNTNGLRATGATLPALLKKSGYATGLLGKWHLGYLPEMSPNAHGFDEFFGFLGGLVDYYTHLAPNRRPDLYENSTPVETPRYLTDEITDRAVSFIDRHSTGPFFLEVAYNAVHAPFEPPDQPPPDSMRHRFNARAAEQPGDSGAHSRQDYVRMLERADEGVGKIMEALEHRNLTANTLVIFTNDNGGEWLSRNAPFFNRKGTLWEGGIRVPLIFFWPGHVRGGTTTQQVALTMDVTASILSAAGVSPDPAFPMDGIDLLPTASGARPVVERDVYWRLPPPRNQHAVRSGRWKLFVDEGGGASQIMLFDLSRDSGERQDLVLQYPARVAQLRHKITDWEHQVAPDTTRHQ